MQRPWFDQWNLYTLVCIKQSVVWSVDALYYRVIGQARGRHALDCTESEVWHVDLMHWTASQWFGTWTSCTGLHSQWSGTWTSCTGLHSQWSGTWTSCTRLHRQWSGMWTSCTRLHRVSGLARGPHALDCIVSGLAHGLHALDCMQPVVWHMDLMHWTA